MPGLGAENAGTGFIALAQHPLFWMAIAAVIGVGWLLSSTPFGLRVRAVGEHPAAATSVGISVTKVRYLAVMSAGALAGLGGVYLALDQHQFSAEMTAGRGFIALAATIFGRWQPKRVAIACLFFAAADALQIRLQGSQAVPSQFVEMIPYVLTIIALAGVVGRAVPPRSAWKDHALTRGSW